MCLKAHGTPRALNLARILSAQLMLVRILLPFTLRRATASFAKRPPALFEGLQCALQLFVNRVTGGTDVIRIRLHPNHFFSDSKVRLRVIDVSLPVVASVSSEFEIKNGHLFIPKAFQMFTDHFSELTFDIP
jgi:hypothetical protein